jgi:DNA-binding transcriptional MerR regulator
VDEGTDFMELLELQGNLEMVTKSELLETMRKRGESISVRQLTSLTTENLIPRSARIGSRGGAYPRIVCDLLSFVLRLRRQGLPVNGIRELLPIWRFLRRAVHRDHQISLAEFELIARRTITLPEAWFAVPGVLMSALPCPVHDSADLCALTILLKDGTSQAVSDEGAVSIGFCIAIEDEETHTAKPYAQTRLAIPQKNEGFNSSSIVLGIPMGVPLEQHDEDEQELSAETSANGSMERIEKGA